MTQSSYSPHGSFRSLLDPKTCVKPPPTVHVTQAIDSLLACLPPSDQSERPQETSSWAELDAKLDALAAVLQSLHVEVQTRSALLSKQRNSLAYIHRIPVELLVEVLGNSMERPEVNCVAELSVVCSRWRSVLIDTPSFWAEVRLDEPRVNVILERSKNQPLKVQACTRPYSPKDPRWNHFGQAIAPHAHRWRSFTCDHTASEWIEPIMSSSTLTLLETMDLRSLPSTVLHLAGAPQLREVQLHDANIHWRTAGPPNLTHLSLSTLSRTILPPIAELTEILSLFPLLEDFKLNAISYSDLGVPFDAPLISKRLVLPNLKVLWLTQTDAEVVLHFLALISAEHLSELTIGSDKDYENFDGEEALAGLSQEDAVGSCILTALRSGEGPIEVTFREDFLEVACSHSNFQFPGLNLFHMIEDVISAMHLDLVTSPVHLSFTGSYSYAADHTTMDPSYLDRLPTLVKLANNYEAVHLTMILEHLSTPRADGSWPCPLLEEVWLETEFDDYTPIEEYRDLIRALRELVLRRPTVVVRDVHHTVFREGVEGFMGRLEF